MNKTTALYIRVSTSEQNIDLQMESLKAYAQRAGLEITHIFIERGVSGTTKSRPELNKLMTASRNHEFKNVLVWKFDRFARSVSHLLKALEEFNHLDIHFISMQDQIDTSSPMGKAMFALIGVMAELEGDLIRERVKEGMRIAKQKGKRIGRPKTNAHIIEKIQKEALKTDLSITKIKEKVAPQVSRSVVGKIVKNIRKGIK